MKEASSTVPRADRHRLFANFTWFFADRAGRMAVNVLVSVLVARHLGPAEFGLLNFATALTGIAVVMAGLGLESVLLRDLIRGNTPAAWKAAWQLRMTAALAAYVVPVIVSIVSRPDSPRVWAVVAMVGAGLLFAPADLVDVWFQAKGRVRPPAFARQCVLWVAVGWRLILIARGAALEAFALAMALESAGVAGALRLTIKRETLPVGTPADVAVERRRLLREGWPLMASGVLVTLTMQVDRLMLGQMRGDAELGIYGAAVRITEIFHLLPVAVGVAAMPRLTSLHQAAPLQYWSLARRLVGTLALAGLAVGGVLAWVGPRLLTAIFGTQYEPAAEIIVVHVWSLVFVFIVSARSRLLVIEAGTASVLAMSLLTASVNVVGNAMLIPSWGGRGAAWAAVGTWAFSALLAPLCFSRTRAHSSKLLFAGATRRVG